MHTYMYHEMTLKLLLNKVCYYLICVPIEVHFIRFIYQIQINSLKHVSITSRNTSFYSSL